MRSIAMDSKYSTKINLHKAYYQIPMYPPDIPKTAVLTPFALFEFTVMPFGLKTAAQTFGKLKHFLGSINYYIRFIPNYAKIAA